MLLKLQELKYMIYLSKLSCMTSEIKVKIQNFIIRRKIVIMHLIFLM